MGGTLYNHDSLFTQCHLYIHGFRLMQHLPAIGLLPAQMKSTSCEFAWKSGSKTGGAEQELQVRELGIAGSKTHMIVQMRHCTNTATSNKRKQHRKLVHATPARKHSNNLHDAPA